MGQDRREDIRNLAIIAHVDHGKTTLTDALIWQCEQLAEPGVDVATLVERAAHDREKAVTVMAKITSVVHDGVRINLLDTPGHANFGSEVQRTLRMVEGFLLLVDACEGPLPQTRFVLRRALETGLAPIVVINKIDRPGARPTEVLEEVRELFLDLDASEEQQRFAVLYCNALQGTCRRDPGGRDEMMMPLLEEIRSTVPAPEYDTETGCRFLVTDLDYDDFLGRLAIGRVFHGTLRRGDAVAHCRLDGGTVPATVQGIYGCEGLQRVERDEAGPGDVVSVTGVEAVTIGDTLAEPANPEPLPPVRVDEPTLAMVVSVNDSPTAGLDGKLVTVGDLKERIWKEILTNVSIRVEETDQPNAFRISGRGELQLVILIEMMRREGYEMLVGKPRVLTRETDGELQEPVEILVLDCPEEFVAVVTRKVEDRRGRLVRMINHGKGRVRQEFRIPSRGLLGFRAEFINDTRGTGILNHVFDGYLPWQGEIPGRNTGVLVADRPGRATAHAIEHLQPRGTIFVAPGDQVYEGMVVGENSKANDVEVNITKHLKPGQQRPGRGAQAMRMIPPRSMSLEHALEFIRDDEVVEVTPWGLRLRKRVLQAARRPNP